jgi:hypothetical protein
MDEISKSQGQSAVRHAGKSGRRIVSAFVALAFTQETPEAANQQ